MLRDFLYHNTNVNFCILTRPYCATTSLCVLFSIFSKNKIKSIIIEKNERTKYSAKQRLFLNNQKALLSELSFKFTILFQKESITLIHYYLLDKLTNFFNLLFWNNLKAISKLLQFELQYVQTHSSEECTSIIQDNKLKYAFLSSSSWILGSNFLKSINLKIINIHPGHLPRHRSLDSIPWSIYSAEPLFITSHFVDSGIDTGPILIRQPIHSFKYDFLTYIKLRIIWIKVLHINKTLSLLQVNSISPTEQDLSHGEHHTPMSYAQLKDINRRLSEKFDSENYSNPIII